MTTTIQEFIGDAFYPLCLRIKELRVLQTALNAGPSAILTRLQSGEWLVDDIIQTIRLGLIGGGMDHRQADKLVEDYVCNLGPLLQYQLPAIKVILAALVGDAEDQPDAGEPVAPVKVTETTSLDS